MESEEKIKELVKRVLDLPIEDRLKVIDIVMQATKAEQDDFELTEEQKARNTNEDPPIEGFNPVEWSRQVKRNFAKKWTDENGNPDWDKLKQILAETEK